MTQAVQRTPWLISRQDDLAWLIGSSLLAFVVIAGYYALTEPLGIRSDFAALAIGAAWSITLDGTHLFATYSRTLLDRQFVAERSAFLWTSTIVFAVGPLFVLAAFLGLGESGMRAASVVFVRFALSWAYYHVCRQHWGVVVLYRNKDGETDPFGRRLDAWLLATGFAYPFAYANARVTFSLSPAESTWIAPEVWLPLAGGLSLASAASLGLSWLGGRRGALEIERSARWLGVVGLGLAAAVAAMAQLGISALLGWLERGLAVAFVLAAAASAIYALRSPRPLNRPKWGMIASALLAHNAILALTSLPPIIPLIALTLFHNVQYHRIVRFHNVHHYAGESASAVGWAKRVTDSMGLFCALAVAFAVFYALARNASFGLESHELLQYLLTSLVWGIAFHHYVIDAVIWRPSRSPRLNADLQIRA